VLFFILIIPTMERVWSWSPFTNGAFRNGQETSIQHALASGEIITITREDVPLEPRFAFINFPDEESLYITFIWGRKKEHRQIRVADSVARKYTPQL
jgi:hypothetical protein